MPKNLPALCGINECRRLDGHSGSHEKWPDEAWSFLSAKDKEKINKAGYATPRGGHKGAYQNHVYRNNKVIIPYEKWNSVNIANYKDGFVVRLYPEQYFASAGRPKAEFTNTSPIVVGTNAFILYRSHESYSTLPPLAGWTPRTVSNAAGNTLPTRRGAVADHGHYVLRLPQANGHTKQDVGPPQGIFAPEYADAETNYLSQCILAWLIIHTDASGFTDSDATHLLSILHQSGLDDAAYFAQRGTMINGFTQCPLCYKVIKYPQLHETIAFEDGLAVQNAAVQVEGATRSTVVNLFHIVPVVYSELTHTPRNVAWGHALCNTLLGQRKCYSLEDLKGANLKVAIIQADSSPQTFGWISEDHEMIRSNQGAVWIRIVTNTVEGEPLAAAAGELEEDES